MNLITKMQSILFSLGAGLLIAGTVLASPGDERFLGGAFDGYDMLRFDQSDSNTLATAAARFQGGANDGYDRMFINGVHVKDGLPLGFVLIIQ